jgi:hypothetical protein
MTAGWQLRRVLRLGALALGAAVILIAGCTHAIPLKATMGEPAGVAKVPARVGVYYSSDFRNYQHSGSRAGDRWDFPLGQASVTLFNQTFPMLFAGTESVPNLPPLSGGSQLAAVIEPKIEAFDFTLPFLKTGTYTAEITYRFTLYSPKGDPVASWTVKGSGAQKGQAGFEFARWPGEAADLAMRDAATRFLNGFAEVPEVQPWLRQVKASQPQ